MADQQVSSALSANEQVNVDVTQQILRYHQLYGGSDNTQAAGLAASKSLNYAQGATLQRPLKVNASVIPYTFNFKDQIGLFGAENVYVRVDIDIKTIIGSIYEETGWAPADITLGDFVYTDEYVQADIDYGCDEYCQHQPEPCAESGDCGNHGILTPAGCVAWWTNTGGGGTDYFTNCYSDEKISSDIPDFFQPKVSVRLDNLKTGNIYIDTWLDTMIYTKDGEMWPFDVMYLNPKDFFYVGFHARNTRHLPYNIDVIIGEEFLPDAGITDRALIAYTN